MTLTNFDSSLLSKKKRDKALYTWRLSNDTKRNSGDTTVLVEQPTFQSGSVVNNRKMGASVCGCDRTKDASMNYEFNGLSQGNQVQ